jgi:hypothetical protein
MTFGEVVTEVFRRLEESQSNPAFWEESEVKDAINDGWEDLALFTEWYWTEVTIPLQDGITYYDLRDWSVDEFIAITDVWNVTLERWLDPTSVTKLQEGYHRWEVADYAASSYLIRGNFTFGVYGRPSIGDNSDFVSITGKGIPQPLGSDDYLIPLPDHLAEALILYALYDLKVQEGEVSLGLDFWEQYNVKAAEITQWTRNSVNHAAVRVLHETS